MKLAFLDAAELGAAQEPAGSAAAVEQNAEVAVCSPWKAWKASAAAADWRQRATWMGRFRHHAHWRAAG